MTHPHPHPLRPRRPSGLFGGALLGLAGLFTLTAIDSARAQTSCPPGGPQIVFYSVTASTEPERTFGAAMREAIVVGGDINQGSVRIFMRFAEPLSSSCVADVYLWRHPTMTSFGRPGQTDRDPRVYFQELFPERVASTLEVAGDGDDTAVVVIPTNPYIAPTTRYDRHDVWFSIGSQGSRHPFTVQQRSSTLDFRAAASSSVGRAPVQVTATSSIQIHPDADFPIQFSVAPATAGGFLVGSTRHPNFGARIDSGISPSRVNATFVGTVPTTPTLVTILANMRIADPVYTGGRAGEERSVTVTVEPEAAPCRIEARVTPRPGGVDITVVNIGTVLCSNMTILTASGPGKTARDTIASLAPGREARLRQSIDPIAVPVVPLTRSTIGRTYGRVSIYWEMRSGPPMPIGNHEFTREDLVLMNSR